MTRGCAITVYFDQKANIRYQHWEWDGMPPGWDGAAKKIPICIQGDGGSDWDIKGYVVSYMDVRPTQYKHEIKAWNPAIGYPYVIIKGTKHTLSKYESAEGDGYTVERLNDSDNWIEYKITFHK